ncbi:MAG: M3 family oligoendopeptidase [Treponema sp.]|nr:M3 family oligoendopeptidase [Treponema sp.]
MDSIYPGIESNEYKKALKDYSEGMDSLDNLLKTAETLRKTSDSNFDFPLWLSTYLNSSNKIDELAETLYSYSSALYSTDTTNTAYLNNLQTLDDLNLRSMQQNLKFKDLLSNYEKSLEDFYTRFPEFKEYKFVLNEELEETKHQMSRAEEKLAGDMQKTGGNAWDRLHEQIISNLRDKESGKMFNELRNDAFSSDGKIRKSAWEKEIQLLKDNEIAFAASLNNLKGETVMLNKRRNWKEAIDRSLASARMKRETLNALTEAIEDSLPMWRDYLQTKALLLKKEKATVDESNNKGLAFYDLFAPLQKTENEKKSASSDSDKVWTFDEAKKYIIERYSSFSENMGNFAKKAFDGGWIDAEVYEGKVGGAYCTDMPVQKESRILSNFTGTFNDVITLAHELGHAFHSSCIRKVPYALSQYPMTLAETASTFAETIVKQDMISRLSGFEKMKMIELDLQDSCQVLVDILCRFYFEKSVFDEREKGELNADDFCRLMKDAQERSYGNGLNESRHEYMWAVKSHYYSTGLDFYNFPYAFGQLFATGLYERYRKEGKGFTKVYEKLLEDTGKMTCEDLCKEAGFDITKKDFWASGIEMFKEELKLLKDYAEKL